MLPIEVSPPSGEQVPSSRPLTLADLSRNASVISSSSSSSSTGSVIVETPRPRPLRTFSSPRSASRDAPPTPRTTRAPPPYLHKELGLVDDNDDLRKRAQSRSKSRARTAKSRNSSAGCRLTENDFEFGEILGEGSYSSVHLAIYPPTEQEYAIKVLDKAHLKRHNKTQTAIAEKNTLVRLGSGHPGIVRLHWAFHNDQSLFFVLDLARNGELQSRISRLGSLSLECARYYAAQIVDAVAYMHGRGVIHRDLKPENLLLDDNMRIKITDFGTGKLITEEEGNERAGTFVGTAQYVSPELLTTNSTTKASDIWAVGCIIFQMIAGKFPFQALSEYLMWQKVKNLEYAFPDGFDEVAKDLVQKLLVLDPTHRLGAGEPGTPYDIEALRKHPFFSSVDWDTLWSDPAPPMESGLVKKEHPLSENGFDVGFQWDQLVGSSNSSGNNSPWEEGSAEEGFMANGYPFTGAGDEVGPLDIVPPPSNLSGNVAAVDEADLRGRVGLPIPFPAASKDTHQGDPIDVSPRNGTIRGSIISSSSTTSSSEGSPVGRLNSTMDAMSLATEQGRGRLRAQTPIQLTAEPDAKWAALLLPGEKLVFHGPVELKSRTRRLTATLLPIPATQNRPKIRHLMLTTQRLVCAKVKHGRKISLKSEALLRAGAGPGAGMGALAGAPGTSPEKGAEKEKKQTIPVITSVLAKGQRTFIVMTTGKPQQYAAEPEVKQRWMEELQALIKPPTGPAFAAPATTASPTPVRTGPGLAVPFLNGLPART